jgi:toxin ParE1/3/4
MKRFRVRLTARAEEDLIGIWFSIAGESPVNAGRFLDVLNERIDMLSHSPDRGVARPEIGKGVLMLIEGNYLILYRVNSSNVEIVRVIHGARDLRDILED